MNTLKIWRIAIAMIAVFFLTSCDKDDPFEETDSGKNTLASSNSMETPISWTAQISTAR